MYLIHLQPLMFLYLLLVLTYQIKYVLKIQSFIIIPVAFTSQVLTLLGNTDGKIFSLEAMLTELENPWSFSLYFFFHKIVLKWRYKKWWYDSPRVVSHSKIVFWTIWCVKGLFVEIFNTYIITFVLGKYNNHKI